MPASGAAGGNRCRRETTLDRTPVQLRQYRRHRLLLTQEAVRRQCPGPRHFLNPGVALSVHDGGSHGAMHVIDAHDEYLSIRVSGVEYVGRYLVMMTGPWSVTVT